MKRNQFSVRYALVLFLLGLSIISCQKLKSPVLGKYPVDVNPPGGPLKFYAAFEGINVDSIRANFGVPTGVSFVPGVTGQGIQLDGSKNGFLVFPSANDFTQSKSFTISFWINITLAQKDNNHAVGILGIGNSQNFWGNATFFADNTTKGTSDSMDLKIHFNNTGNTDDWNFANYTHEARWPHMYDGNWHNIGFTYDATTLTGTVYRDGVQFDQKTNQNIAFENGAQVVVGGYQEAAGVVDTYSNNTWMAGFPGKMDQFRLYGVALSAADMANIYAKKL